MVAVSGALEDNVATDAAPGERGLPEGEPRGGYRGRPELPFSLRAYPKVVLSTIRTVALLCPVLASFRFPVLTPTRANLGHTRANFPVEALSMHMPYQSSHVQRGRVQPHRGAQAPECTAA